MDGWCSWRSEVIVEFHSHLCCLFFHEYGDVEKENLILSH